MAIVDLEKEKSLLEEEQSRLIENQFVNQMAEEHHKEIQRLKNIIKGFEMGSSENLAENARLNNQISELTG